MGVKLLAPGQQVYIVFSFGTLERVLADFPLAI